MTTLYAGFPESNPELCAGLEQPEVFLEQLANSPTYALLIANPCLLLPEPKPFSYTSKTPLVNA